MKTKRALTITFLLASMHFFGTIQPMTITRNVIIEENPFDRAYIVLRGTRFHISKATLEMNELYEEEKDFQERAGTEESKKKIKETDGIITWNITEAMDRLKAEIDDNALATFLRLTAGIIPGSQVGTLVLTKVIMLADYFQNTHLNKNNLIQKLANQITAQNRLDFINSRGILWDIIQVPSLERFLDSIAEKLRSPERTLTGPIDVTGDLLLLPNGNIAASSLKDKIIAIWDPATGKLLLPSGNIVAASNDHIDSIMNPLTTYELLNTFMEHDFLDLLILPDGNVAFLSKDKTIKIRHTDVFKNLTFKQIMLVSGLYLYKTKYNKPFIIKKQSEKIFKTLPKEMKKSLLGPLGWTMTTKQLEEAKKEKEKEAQAIERQRKEQEDIEWEEELESAREWRKFHGGGLFVQ